MLEERTYQWLAKPTPDLFVPLESRYREDKSEIEWNKRLVIGHNVGYDRSCLKEQYYIKVSKGYLHPAELLVRFEVGRDILKVDDTFYFIYFFLKAFLTAEHSTSFQPAKMFKFITSYTPVIGTY